MFEHKHPLTLIDLRPEHLQDEEDEEEENEGELIAREDFRCLCCRCDEEITCYHRYYQTCCQCDYSIHQFCAELPEKLEDSRHEHTLYLLQQNNTWWCDTCRSYHKPEDLRYRCSICDFDMDANCATKRLQRNIIYHPSHTHPLVCLARQLLCECDACGKEHKGIFYHCTICPNLFIHNHCASLPQKLQIQHYTYQFFTHIHMLTLTYSFQKADQTSKFNPRCRICLEEFDNPFLWIYKCEKCRYYTHLDCATSRNEPFMSILTSPGTGGSIKNYEDAKHPGLVHLPFPDPSYSILKHFFFNENIPSTLKTSKNTIINISHQHPLILKDVCNDITIPTSSKIKSITYHDPMKRIELLCNGCLRPVMNAPIYLCDNEDEQCKFVLHEWCSRLPTELKDHHDHPQHTLFLHSTISGKFFGVFTCNICRLPCNGFAYCCEECNYYIDVHCAFLPKEITHNSHPNHLLSRSSKYKSEFFDDSCSMCDELLCTENNLFHCNFCNFHLHATCALLVPETTTHKCDKHPMKLSYFPIENHSGEYFCEICEKEFDPKFSFYHCYECMQSVHSACAPSILQNETHTVNSYFSRSIHLYVNVKFGGTYDNIKVHPHTLSFVQGIKTDGRCDKCGQRLRYEMIYKCSDCKFALDYECLCVLHNSDFDCRFRL